MTGFRGLTKRNLLIYFKDIHAVIFSMLTSIIVFALYMLFLKGNYVDAIKSVSVGLEGFVGDNDIEMLVSAILLTGIIGSALITIPYSCLTTVIKDRENKIDYDISATPIKRWQIILSYFLSAIISSFVVTGIILTVGIVSLAMMGDINMSFFTILKIYGIDFLGCVSSTGLFMCMVLFFKSSSASSAFFGMLSAASGFAIGAYIPLSSFSESIQTTCNLLPATQITVFLRNGLMDGILKKINDAIGGADGGAFLEGIHKAFNFDSVLFGNVLSKSTSLIYILSIFAVSIAVMITVYSKTYKR